MATLDNTQVTRATGNAAIATTVTMAVRWRLLAVKLHLSAVGGAVENFTATLDSVTAAAYDTVHYSLNMNAVADLVWVPDPNIFFEAADELDFAYANTNGRTYGLEVYYIDATLGSR